MQRVLLVVKHKVNSLVLIIMTNSVILHLSALTSVHQEVFVYKEPVFAKMDIVEKIAVNSLQL